MESREKHKIAEKCSTLPLPVNFINLNQATPCDRSDCTSKNDPTSNEKRDKYNPHEWFPRALFRSRQYPNRRLQSSCHSAGVNEHNSVGEQVTVPHYTVHVLTIARFPSRQGTFDGRDNLLLLTKKPVLLYTHPNRRRTTTTSKIGSKLKTLDCFKDCCASERLITL